MNIRPEERTDFKEVELLIREAFWNVYRPGCYEHYIIHNLRHDPSFVKKLDYVAEMDGKIVAHIAYSTNGIYDGEEKTADVVTLGPVSVHPDYQKQGIGSTLIRYTLDKAQEMEISCVFVIGDENYYSRFGFVDASQYGIQFNDITDDTPFFMVKSFDEEKVKSLKGNYRDNEIFNVDQNELDIFDKKFPPKQKEKREGQLDF